MKFENFVIDWSTLSNNFNNNFSSQKASLLSLYSCVYCLQFSL